MRPDLFSIGPITIHGYGLMIGIGFLAAILIGMKRAEKHGLDKDIVFNMGLLCIVGGMLGAKILYVITEWNNIIHSKNLWSDLAYGFVVYGGIIGGILILYVYSRFKKLNFLQYMDLIVPSVSIGQGFGRIGCLLAGCCYGRETDCPIGIVFHNSEFAPNGVSLLPTQIFSSIGDFLIAGFLIWYAGKQKKDGKVISMYLILYGVGRFIVEIFRNDPRGNVGMLSTSQFISIFMVAFGAGMMYFVTHRKKKEE
ncbi:prolipoprotein diacylglyceryl transferase [uncultured Robinsoniella sp.]|uniref:prolipoprotein diacylglyceryl transferase n=1 Tax=uncultured Robinsoniella sp. TaxID=904190 RepID=UPI00374E3311